MGRSRGGLTTKIHALVDANGMPIALKLTAGQQDGRSAADMLETLGDRDVLLADRAYDSDALTIEMAARGPTSSPCTTARVGRSSAPSFTDTTTSSSTSSTKSSSSELWQLAMANATTTSLPLAQA